MSYQNTLIKKLVEMRLRRSGVCLSTNSALGDLIAKNIRRLNEGDHIAIECDNCGNILAVQKIDGFSCLHSIGENALIISYRELERFFNEQQCSAMEF